ncbi:MAG: hypothetical protein AAGK22_18190 [Acidobacteriota bacterium]
MKKPALVILSLFCASVGLASNAKDAPGSAPTFYKDVLPVLQANCQTCHRPNGANLGGMVAPMSFTDYESTRPWARSIAKQAVARTMPPWHAASEHAGVFANERTMAQEDIDTLVAWAKSGAKPGSVADAPPAADFPEHEGWSIGEPDLVIDMGQDYFVEDGVEDEYVTFRMKITKEMLPEPRYLRAVEFRPGSSVVHHIIAAPFGGIAPGNDPTIYNDGFGTLIKPGIEVAWQMHYHKEAGPGSGVWDRSSAALKFYPEGYVPEHIVANDPLARFDFLIPAGAGDYSATTATVFERDSLLLGYTPHMHLRGKAAKYVAFYPDGTEEVLLHVPSYDFNWQTNYEYPGKGKRIPAGTRVELTMWWDNSEDNPFNPDPTVDVHFGEPTTDEMMFGFVTYADAEPGYVPKTLGFLNSSGGR